MFYSLFRGLCALGDFGLIGRHATGLMVAMQTLVRIPGFQDPETDVTLDTQIARTNPSLGAMHSPGGIEIARTNPRHSLAPHPTSKSRERTQRACGKIPSNEIGKTNPPARMAVDSQPKDRSSST
jgi:hypothetical protein